MCAKLVFTKVKTNQTSRTFPSDAITGDVTAVLWAKQRTIEAKRPIPTLVIVWRIGKVKKYANEFCYHALASNEYKLLVVSGLVHRIYRPCSSWKHVHDKVKNEYTSSFFNQ